jgi:hypothetical protein
MKNAFASKICAAACAVALVATPAVAIAQPANTVGAPIVAQSYDASHDYTASYYTALSAVGLEDWEVSLTTLDTYFDEDGFLVDHVGFNAYGIHYDVEVDYYNASFYSWTCYAL